MPAIVCRTTLLSLILVVTPGVYSVPSSPINFAVRPAKNRCPETVISCVPAPDTVVGVVENINGGKCMIGTGPTFGGLSPIGTPPIISG